MITIYKEENVTYKPEEQKVVEFRGLSTDTKPTEKVANGSVYVEINTGKIYLYDAENEQWNEI